MLLEAKIWTLAKTDQGNAIFIRPIGSDEVVPIFIGLLEAQSILLALGEVPLPRPMTHDLILNIFDLTKLKLDRIEITKIQNDTYFSRLCFKKGKENLELDSRPSDAIGLAVRTHAKIFIDDKVVKESAIRIVDLKDAVEFGTLKEEKAELEDELAKAIENENYEEAALIRDRLNEIISHFHDHFKEDE